MLNPLPFSNCVAPPALTKNTSVRLYHYIGISFIEKVASLAMSSRALASAICFSSERQSCRKNTPLGRNNFGHIQANAGPLNNRVCLEAATFRKFYGKMFATFNGDDPRNPLISLLLFSRCPAAIFRSVVSVVVLAVKRVSVWPRPHVNNERCVTVSPSFAHGNSTPSVILPLLEISLCASADHSLPNGIQRRLGFEWHNGLQLWGLEYTT